MPLCFICKTKIPAVPVITLWNTGKRLCVENECKLKLIDWVSEKQATKQAKVREKARKKKDRVKLAVHNQTIKYWRPKADDEFQLFSRLMDESPTMTCISCGRTRQEILADDPGRYYRKGVWDGGHYIGKGCHGSDYVRYSEDNCNAQCVSCNRDKSGNPVRYRVNLIKRIGVYRVELLEMPHGTPHFKWYDYKAVRDWYARINKILKQELEGE